MNLNIKFGKYRPKHSEVIDAALYDDDELAPVMPAIDAVQQLLDNEDKSRTTLRSTKSNGSCDKINVGGNKDNEPIAGTSKQLHVTTSVQIHRAMDSRNAPSLIKKSHHPPKIGAHRDNPNSPKVPRPSNEILKNSPAHRVDEQKKSKPQTPNDSEIVEEDDSLLVSYNPLENLSIPYNENKKQDEYEFIPKSVILDVYSNDPEVKRFLKQLPKIHQESGLNEQDYKCYSCRRPIGLVFGNSKLCHFDGHHYCSECHLGEKSVIPARILCNWDFNKFQVSKRNQHFLALILNESMFELKKISPLLYKVCPELREIEDLRRQAFFVRSYCTTCVQDSISFELTKLIWPREHLIKQIDIYSLEDLVQIENGSLKQVLKNVITFGRQHVLSCVLCCQKGFICELCKSSQIIYPFDTESVHRCNECQSIYHKSCFKSRPDCETCPRCQRLEARRQDA